MSTLNNRNKLTRLVFVKVSRGVLAKTKTECRQVGLNNVLNCCLSGISIQGGRGRVSETLRPGTIYQVSNLFNRFQANHDQILIRQRRRLQSEWSPI